MGEVVRISKGKKPIELSSSKTSNAKRFIQIDDLRNNNILKYTEDKSGVIVAENDVLIAWDGANAGTVGFGLNGYIGSTLARLEIIKENISTNFLGWFLRTKSKHLRDNSTGATIPHLSRIVLESLKIPLPPLSIQKQIAEILEKANQAKQKRKETNKLTVQFLQSAFIEMFGDPVKNPKGWEVKRFDEITEIIMGQSPLGDTYNEVGNGFPLLNGPAEFGEKYPVEVQWTSNPTKMSKVNDILFCVRGATAGRMNWSDKEYCIGRGLAAIRSRKNSKIEVIYFFLKIKYLQFQSLGQGSTFINLSKGLISSMKMPVPPLYLQLQFAELVQKTEALKEKQKESEIELENLFNSLMQKAFKGELV
ncbi:MAG: restriction endonuclease subunit S [Bacteroidetes bacterium]|nr:restriction endonuclease subunit S [Bacteroidota bacterium]